MTRCLQRHWIQNTLAATLSESRFDPWRSSRVRINHPSKCAARPSGQFPGLLHAEREVFFAQLLCSNRSGVQTGCFVGFWVGFSLAIGLRSRSLLRVMCPRSFSARSPGAASVFAPLGRRANTAQSAAPRLRRLHPDAGPGRRHSGPPGSWGPAWESACPAPGSPGPRRRVRCRTPRVPNGEFRSAPDQPV